MVLVAANYQGREQAQALGWLGAAEAMGGVLAFLVAGSLGTWLGWRYPFGLLVSSPAASSSLSRQLQPVERQPDVKIDAVGVVLAALAIILISVGFDSINNWGVMLATDAAPFDLVGPVAGAGYDRDRNFDWPGILCLVEKPRSREKDAADRFRSD